MDFLNRELEKRKTLLEDVERIDEEVAAAKAAYENALAKKAQVGDGSQLKAEIVEIEAIIQQLTAPAVDVIPHADSEVVANSEVVENVQEAQHAPEDGVLAAFNN